MRLPTRGRGCSTVSTDLGMHTPVASFLRQLDVLADHDVVSLDEAIERLRSGDDRPWVVLTKPLEPSDTRPPATDRLHLRSSNRTSSRKPSLSCKMTTWSSTPPPEVRRHGCERSFRPTGPKRR